MFLLALGSPYPCEKKRAILAQRNTVRNKRAPVRSSATAGANFILKSTKRDFRRWMGTCLWPSSVEHPPLAFCHLLQQLRHLGFFPHALSHISTLSTLVMHPHCWCHWFPVAQWRWAAQNIMTTAGSLFVLVDLKGCKYATLPKTAPSEKEGSSLSCPLISYFFPLSVAVDKTACPSRVKLPWECDWVEEEQGAQLHQRQPHHCQLFTLAYSSLLIEKGGPKRPRELLRAYF